MAGQMPITPPDSGSGYAYTSMHYPRDPYASQQSMSQCRQDNAYDYQQQAYMQPPVAPAPPTYQFQQNSYQASASLPPIQSYYEPIGAPILPPLRIHDHVPFADDYQRRLQQEQQDAALREQQRQAAKEEKATGGVSAKLDYDMERMTDFVAKAVQSIFQTASQPHPSFRKWVHQVLSATRLPSATIQLSLHYLNDRLARFPASVVQGENQIYRLLAVSLILGSKFLDDNTFINRSWSDVTAIKVSELNHLEMKWLSLISYNLHIDGTDPNGFMAWRSAWQQFDEEAEHNAKKLIRLSPLDTNVHRHTSSSRDRYSPYPTPQTATPLYSRSFDAPLSARASQFSTPYSASDPWAANHRPAEDFYKRQDRYPSTFELEDNNNRRASDERARQSAYPYSQMHSYHATPGWDQFYQYDYSQHYRPYPMTSSYAPQPVMG